jgi:hypothetical protein
MEVTIEQINRHLKFSHAPDKRVTIGSGREKSPELFAVEWIVDIAGFDPVPGNTVRYNVEKQHNVTDRDHVHSYAVDTFQEGINLLRQFCKEHATELSDEDVLRLEKNAGNFSKYLVFIIERPFYR